MAWGCWNIEIADWRLLILRLLLLRITLRVPHLLIWRLLLLGITRRNNLRVIILLHLLRHSYTHHRLGNAHGNHSNHPNSWHNWHTSYTTHHDWSPRLTRGALWDELSLEVDTSSLLALKGESEPVSHSFVNTELGSLHKGTTYLSGSYNVIVLHIELQLIAHRFQVDIEAVIPHGLLAGTIHDLGLELIPQVEYGHVGIHLPECLNVAVEIPLDHLNG